MKIIDFARKGNVVRFYLGEDNLEEWHGDDWDDTPYEHNASLVYDRYISGYKDISFSYDDLVLEPSSGEYNSDFCKNDMIAKRVPCLLVVPNVDERIKSFWIDDRFRAWVGSADAIRYYFGDPMEPDVVLPKE